MPAPLDPPVEADAHYFTLEELSAEQDVTGDDAVIERNRALAEEVIERGAGVAFLPRRRIERLPPFCGGGVRLAMRLVRDVEALDIDGDPWSPEEIAERIYTQGQYLIGLHLARRATVTYTYGYDQPPERIRRAAMIATRVWTERGPVDDRATQIASDGATINLATPGLRGSLTGIPEVDAAITSYRRGGYVL